MHSAGETLNPTAQKHYRRNFAMGVVNAAAFQVAETMIDSSLVLTWFLSQLTGPNLLIGLPAPIRNAGWFLPQLLVSGYVQRQERKLRLYQIFAVVRVVSFALLTAATWLWGARHPQWLLVTFLLLLTIFSLAEGISGISFLDVVAKCIPARRRGSYFAYRNLVGGILALGSSVVVRYILGERSGLTFPDNFALLFASALIFIAIGVLAFSLVIEPLEPTNPQIVSLRQQLRRAWDFARTDRNYARLILVRVALLLAGGLATPFYIVYAKDMLGATAGSIGTFLLVLTLAAIGSNLFWGRLCDRRGNRAVILLSCVIGICVPLTVMLAGYMRSLSLLFLPVALQGIYQSSIMIGQVNFVLEIAPPAERPTYLGLINTALGVVTFTLAMGGLIVDLAGYHALFLLAAFFFVPAFWLTWGLKDPRAG